MITNYQAAKGCERAETCRGHHGAHLRKNCGFRVLFTQGGIYQPKHDGAALSAVDIIPSYKALTKKAVRRRVIVSAIEAAMIMLMFLGIVFICEMICKAVTG